MKQFVFGPAFKQNRSFNTQSVTKRKHLMYQAFQNPKCQIDSLNRGINKNLFVKADSLEDKKLSCPRIKLLSLQNLSLDAGETEVLFSDYAQQLRRGNANVLDIYFSLLDAAGTSPVLVLKKTNSRDWTLGQFQNTKTRSCKDCTYKMVLLVGLCKTK